MPISKADAETFFSHYAEALGSHDPARIADHWGVPGLVLSDEGAIAVGDAAQIKQFFAASMDQYEGVASAHATIKSATALSEHIIACEIAWEHRDADDQSVGGEAGSYILRREGDRILIHLYTPRLA